jgi:hypothetical protein
MMKRNPGTAFGLFEFSMIPQLRNLLKRFGLRLIVRRSINWGDQVEVDIQPLEKNHSSTAGVWIKYCGHNGCFIADIVYVSGAVVVRANGPVTPDNINRDVEAECHLMDFPFPGFWRPDLGIFVVPKAQLQVM